MVTKPNSDDQLQQLQNKIDKIENTKSKWYKTTGSELDIRGKVDVVRIYGNSVSECWGLRGRNLDEPIKDFTVRAYKTKHGHTCEFASLVSGLFPEKYLYYGQKDGWLINMLKFYENHDPWDYNSRFFNTDRKTAFVTYTREMLENAGCLTILSICD